MVRICKTSLDLLEFPNFSIFPMLWQFLEKIKQRTLGVKLDMTKHDFDYDNRTLVWKSACMYMEELLDSLGETKNYYGGTFCCFGQHYYSLF